MNNLHDNRCIQCEYTTAAYLYRGHQLCQNCLLDYIHQDNLDPTERGDFPDQDGIVHSPDHGGALLCDICADEKFKNPRKKKER